MKNQLSDRKSYLDGLRGLAALGVVAFHSSIFFSVSTWTEALSDTPNLVLSRFTNGNFMVCIFFILSGYVLVIPRVSNLDITSPGYWGELILRRYFRLTPVALASVLLVFFLWVTLGIPNKSLTDFGTGFAWMTNEYAFTPNFFDALYYGVVGIYTLPEIQYNGVLWSVGIELFGSIALFCMLALFPKIRNFLIMSGIFSIIIAAFTFNKGMLSYGLYIILFFVGAIIHLVSAKLKSRTVMVIFLLLSLWLGSISAYTPEGEWLMKTFSLSSFYTDAIIHSIAAIMILLAVVSSRTLQNVLSLRPIFYLGKISFSLYAIHVPVIFCIALHVFVGLVPLYQIRLAGLITYCTIFIVSLFLAGISTKYIDLPSQRFAKRFARFLLSKEYNL